MKLITRAFNKLVFKIQTNTNKYYGEKRKKSLLRPDFSIISNNCWGGGSLSIL